MKKLLTSILLTITLTTNAFASEVVVQGALYALQSVAAMVIGGKVNKELKGNSTTKKIGNNAYDGSKISIQENIQEQNNHALNELDQYSHLDSIEDEEDDESWN